MNSRLPMDRVLTQTPDGPHNGKRQIAVTDFTRVTSKVGSQSRPEDNQLGAILLALWFNRPRQGLKEPPRSERKSKTKAGAGTYRKLGTTRRRKVDERAKNGTG
jgi:hypothetical protein